MRRITTVEVLRGEVSAARSAGRRIGLVPTMGALHDGHVALVGEAAERLGPGGFLVVSVFVNPTQFGPGEDFAAYPRDLEADEATLRTLGDAAPDVVYAPETAEMYPGWTPGEPPPILTTVHVRDLTTSLCGASRPGHFDGVCTVVAKLLHQVRPDVAFFGRKDFQQLRVIGRMVRDLDMAVEVVGVPTVREADGLALSSRNAYLSTEERDRALVLSRGLAAAVRAAREARATGRTVSSGMIRDAALGTIAGEPHVNVDYVDVVDPETLQPPDPTARPAAEDGEATQLLLAVAAHVGPARLIDNVVVGDADDEDRLLGAVG